MARPADTVTALDLGGGLRGVHLHVPRLAVAYTGVAVLAGSRDETTPEQYGLAHFVEHTLFKGTARRSAWHIANRMERVGGELNAFTGKEDTVIYSAFPKAYTSRALDLIADLITASRFDGRQLDKERMVVDDEISSYLDSPADAVFDDFEDALFAGCPLGHNILGTRRSVAALTTADCRAWIDRHYTRGNMVVFYAGPSGAEVFARAAQKAYAGVHATTCCNPKRLPVHINRFDTAKCIDSHQAHIVTGTATAPCTGQQRIALALMTNMVGGPGLNSLFNQQLREKRGLVYTVDASASNLTDASMFSVYFGCDGDDTALCRRLVSETMSRLADGALTQKALKAAARQYLGQMTLAAENIENRIIGIARATLLHGRAMTSRQISEGIAALTTADIAMMAARFAPVSAMSLMPGRH